MTELIKFKCRDNLRAYLRPFAEEGKVVAEADVQTFFEQLNKARAEANAVSLFVAHVAERQANGLRFSDSCTHTNNQ